MSKEYRLAGIEQVGRRVLVAAACMLASSAGAQTAAPIVDANGPNVFVARFQLGGPGFDIAALADYGTTLRRSIGSSTKCVGGFRFSDDRRKLVAPARVRGQVRCG